MHGIAVILPVYNEEKAIYQHFAKIRQVLEADGLHCSFVLIDDGSKDNTYKELLKIAHEYSNVHTIKFSRNFGKEMALRAGIDEIDAEIYVTMDSDLQHPPEHIRPMIELLKSSGVSIVNGKKSSRGKEKGIYKFFAKSFYAVLKKTSGMDMGGGSDFKVMKRQVVDQLRRLGERNLFFRGVVDWVGFSSVDYFFEVAPRQHGSSRFSFGKLMRLAISAITGHTSRPLFLTLVAGFIFLIFALVIGIQTLINFFTGVAVSGFSTVIMLQLIIGALVLICLGLIGLYIARIYDEVKARPTYIVEHRSKRRENENQ